MPPADLRTENLGKQVVHTHTHTHTELWYPEYPLMCHDGFTGHISGVQGGLGLRQRNQKMPETTFPTLPLKTVLKETAES